MSESGKGVRGTPKGTTTGKLSTCDKDSRGQKDNSKARSLEIDHLDRTHGFDDDHYSRKDVAAANEAVEGQSHE